MMRIAIHTIQSNNYGNRLQNYALQSILESEGHQVESLGRSTWRHGDLLSRLKCVRSRVLALCHINGKRGLFYRFNRDFVRQSKLVVSEAYISPGLRDAYDVFVIGSDQVWNPNFSFNGERDYLPFIPRRKKIAYAASFGVSEIEDSERRVAGCLDDISAISVREDAGAEIILALTGRRPAVLLDPTLLMSSSDWMALAKRPDALQPPFRYCLKYVLGSDDDDAEIRLLAAQQALEVVDLSLPDLPVGPREFLWLVANAELICTDSFHASVFSIVFQRPFVVFERQGRHDNMASRFDTLFGILDIRYHRRSSPDYSFPRCASEDWLSIQAKLDIERRRSLAWLREALGSLDS